MEFDTTGAYKGIINLEDLHTHDILESLDCSSNNLRLRFNTAEDWNAAQHDWGIQTQTEHDNGRDFLIIVGDKQCESVGKVITFYSYILLTSHKLYQPETQEIGPRMGTLS